MIFKGLLAALIWAIANIVYLDMKEKGKRGFTRFCAFWAGTPTTWLILFFVKEGQPREVLTPQDNADALLEEIRRDRALTEGEGRTSQDLGSREDRRLEGGLGEEEEDRGP
jgi:hypothetical protein